MRAIGRDERHPQIINIAGPQGEFDLNPLDRDLFGGDIHRDGKERDAASRLRRIVPGEGAIIHIVRVIVREELVPVRDVHVPRDIDRARHNQLPFILRCGNSRLHADDAVAEVRNRNLRRRGGPLFG